MSILNGFNFTAKSHGIIAGFGYYYTSAIKDCKPIMSCYDLHSLPDGIDIQK